MSIWGSRRVPEDATVEVSVGSIRMRFRRNGREWLYNHEFAAPAADAQMTPAPPGAPDQERSTAEERGEDPGDRSEPEPTAETPFRRYVAADRSPLVSVVPVMPDRPVVVASETPFALGPGVEARFYAEIPVWIRATVAGDDRRVLFETPTRKLSNTWFGGVVTGRLCYSLDSPLRFRREELLHNEDTAVCMLRYRNQSRAPFSSGKVAIFADLLRVYRGPEGLWTNEAVATIVGPEQMNLSVSEALPLSKDQLEKLSESRVQATEHLVRKGLILLRSITNY